MSPLRSLVAESVAYYLREHNARCAARFMDKVAVGVVLSASEWIDVENDASFVRHHHRANYATVIGYLARQTEVGDGYAVEKLAKMSGESIDEWAQNTRDEIAKRVAA